MNYEVTLVFSNLYHNIFIEDCKIKCLIYVRGCNKIDLSDFLNRLTKVDNLFENFKVNFMKNKDKVNRCNKCNLPETYETIEFDQENVCNICNGAKYKQTKIDWNERKKLLDQLIEKHKGKYSYDCIVPFSGGKDSTFQLYYLMKNYGLKPLVVRFNHGFYRETILKNTIRTLKKLGADFVEFTPNWKTVKRLMLESFKRKSEFCWHCHTGIHTYPIRLALMYKIPLIFYGEPQSEFNNYFEFMKVQILNII